MNPPPTFWQSLAMNPSPWIGAIIGGFITGGLFGWITYVRNIRPVLIIYRHIFQDGNWLWYVKNIGQGLPFILDSAIITRKVKL